MRICLPLLLLAACGAPPRTGDDAMAGWLAQRNRPLIRMEGTQVSLWAGANNPEQIQIDTTEMAHILGSLQCVVELHRRVLLRGRLVLTAQEAEALGRWRQAQATRPGALAMACGALADEVLHAGTLNRSLVVSRLRSMVPLIEENARHLAQLRLEALHRVVLSFWGRLPPEARVLLRVEVVDSAGARAGHWAVQYFERLWGQEGEGSRILYAEHPRAELDARLLDEETGLDVFEDPERLRRDVLSDGARLWLDGAGVILPAVGAR